MMRVILFSLLLCFEHLMAQEYIPEVKDPEDQINDPYHFHPYPNVLDIFQTVGVTHYTGFDHLLYKDYDVITSSKLPNGVKEEYLLETHAFYGIKFLYKYFYGAMDLGYIEDLHNYYGTKLIPNISEKRKGFTSNIEVGGRFMFLTGVVGYNFTGFNDYDFTQNYQSSRNPNNPYMRLMFSLQWNKLPVWSLVDYGYSSNIKRKERDIHSMRLGILWAITYYINITFSYDPIFITKAYISHNLLLQFDFQLIKELSATFYFKNTTYSPNLPVSNQFYIGINYFLRVEL